MPDKSRLNEIHGEFFDTVNILQADCEQELLGEAMEQCAYFHHLLNRFEEGSDLWRLNHSKGETVLVNEHIVHIIKTGIEISEKSEGAFNMCIGPVSSLWSFRGDAPLPSPERINRAKNLCDWRRVNLRGREVTLPDGMELDIGGIAKGYIADWIADFLKNQGVCHALLNFGGNIITIGTRPDGRPWTIGLQTPGRETGKDYWAAVHMQDETIVTSASCYRGFNRDGIRYHHILDPRTGYPVQNHLQAVTLRGSLSVLADGVSTACFVLGPEKGAELAQAYGMEAAFLTDDGRVLYTPEMNLVL